MNDCDWLKKHYIEKNMTTKEISKLCSVSCWTIERWLRKHSIKKPKDLALKNKIRKASRVSNEEIKKAALKYKTRVEFQKKDCSKYVLACQRGIIDEVCSHMKRQRTQWTLEKLQQEALKYQTRLEFQKKSKAYSPAQKAGVLDSICLHMEPVYEKWTKNKIQQLAKKYKTRKQFQVKDSAAYQAARRLKIIDEICSHMNVVCKKWTNDEIIQEAKKYKTRKEFQRKSRGAYRAAHARDLKKAFSHMKRPGDTSIYEQELLRAIKKYYPSANKKIFCKISHDCYNIKRLDIDIFIPELKKGIEFDGDYWHGEGFKRAWTNCPKVYHRVKDFYFYNKGIKVLHIKERNWLKNKDECIKQSLRFLRQDCV